MKKNVMFMLLTLVALNLTARTPAGGPDPGPAVFSKGVSVEISPLIEAKFKKEYGPIVNVSWRVVEDISIATFSDQGSEKNVFYYNDGETFGFGKAVDIKALPKLVDESLTRKFKKATIGQAYEFKTTGSPTRYYVRMIASGYSVIASATEFGDITVYEKQKNK